MKITLTVNQVAGAPPAQPMTVTFDDQGGSIGRRGENDWVLPDPERFISGRHALIDFSDGAFHITDLSSNGIFINRSAQPMGKNNRVALHHGDSLTIGDYEIGVAIEEPVNQILQGNSFEGLDDPFAKMVDEQAGQKLEGGFPAPLEPQPEPLIDEGYSLEEAETPSLETDESSPETGEAEVLPSQADHVPDLNAYFNQPSPIPEDWDQEENSLVQGGGPEAAPPAEPLPPLDDVPLPGAPEQPALIPDTEPSEEPAPFAIQEPMPTAEQQQPGMATAAATQMPAEPPAAAVAYSGDEAVLRRTLAESMGIDESHFADLPLTTLLQNLGQVMRVSVSGTMSMLRARAQMKGEFRMSQTMIQPVENNPLKFSINIEEALRHIINPNPSSGYLSPLAAFEEAHEDIEAHMLAVMVGMQAALHAVLQRFKPEILEQRLGQQALLEKLPLYRQAKTWELFTELYSEIADEAEDDFHQLFGRTFSQAYEEQIRRLESLKDPAPGSPN
ncbi:MAG: type VI secretion system-associated FHA domain protein TagH [Candidatus Thiodiazotropha sp.]